MPYSAFSVVLAEAYLNAIDEATLEVEEGRYEAQELEKVINQEEIINRALILILPGSS
ncbi:hypothetical protein [Nostoc sp. UHCC 0252]|uniref:hypothetical protein n=1 Tax=Nostoc sp. UHCC 0252 TaxID=3110241 RepID=UPI002B2012FD|nr:hypothetical protein [Nostoc sp. UHCC 0252]MEA5603683.1 hypothetical protein [Nostoc sp. UHCC 0252]